MRTRVIGIVVALLVVLPGAPLSRAQTSDCDGVFHVVKKFRLARLTGISSMTTVENDVWLVGSYNGRRQDHNFLVQWDGASWNWLPVPMPRHGSYYFTGIDTATPDDVWLSATRSNFPTDRPAVLRWTAGKWTRMELPHVDSGNLWDIEVISATDVWAIGNWDTPEPSPTVNPLAFHWDGAEWTRMDPPSGKRWITELDEVDASSPTDVWVLGQSEYFAHWDGTAWTRHSLPRNDDNAYPRIAGIDVVGPDEVWGAGTIETRAYRAQVWRWDGTAFNETSTYDPRGFEFLADVAMTGGTGYAVGNETRGRFNEAMVLRWTGSDWVSVSTERPGLESFLGQVAVTDDGTVWTTGGFDTENSDAVAMVQRSCGPTE